MNHVSAAQAVDVLMEEHRQIERVLRVLRDVAEHALVSSTAPNEETIRAIVAFAEKFADGRHHEKEEKILFVEMHARGFARGSGPIGCMMKQHETGRGLVAALRRWCEADVERRKIHAETMLRAAFEYVEMLSSHISVEDSVLFPAALAHLPNDALMKVASAYRNVDPPSWREELVAAADEIERLGQGLWGE